MRVSHIAMDLECFPFWIGIWKYAILLHHISDSKQQNNMSSKDQIETVGSSDKNFDQNVIMLHSSVTLHPVRTFQWKTKKWNWFGREDSLASHAVARICSANRLPSNRIFTLAILLWLGVAKLFLNKSFINFICMFLFVKWPWMSWKVYF